MNATMHPSAASRRARSNTCRFPPGLAAALVAVAVAFAGPAAPAAEGGGGESPQSAVNDEQEAHEQLCGLIEDAAESAGIPVAFLTRLIWKESRFRADAVSPKGAQGIAQFMPYTAAERGLLDPFDVRTAIPASASLLADLKARFGNLGLAAAAYNAGADRVSRWLADDAVLPWETQDFVLAITGIPADSWTEEEPPELPKADEGKDCLTLAALLKTSPAPLAPEIETASGPWGVQVAGNFSRARAIAAYAALQKRHALIAGKPPMLIGGRMRGRGTRAFYRVRVPAQSRKEAEQICAALKQAGGACIVLKT
jgi:hypothetical protein